MWVEVAFSTTDLSAKAIVDLLSEGHTLERDVTITMPHHKPGVRHLLPCEDCPFCGCSVGISALCRKVPLGGKRTQRRSQQSRVTWYPALAEASWA